MNPVIPLAKPLPGTPLADAIAPPLDGEVQFRQKAESAAQKFEGFFIGQMLKQMRSASRELAPEGSVFKDPVNSDMLDLADRLLADQMAGKHAFGIADVILRQLLPVSSAPAAETLKPAPDPAASSD